jgi:drug/metabolite transporter (DMT)-like permease
MLLSALLSALNGAFTKMLTQDISALEVVFFRNIIGVFLILYALKHTPVTLNGGKFHLLFLRGFLGFSAMILFFTTIEYIPLGEAITLNKTSPFFVTILAYFLLGERLTTLRFLALFLGFLGIICITKPWGMSFSTMHFLGLLGGFFAATAYTTIKKIKDIYDSRVIVLSFVVVGSVLPLGLFMISPYVEVPKSISFLFPPFIVPQDFATWGLIGVMALTATLSQWLLTKAYSATNLSIVGVISYTNIPFALGFGWMLGDGLVDMMSLFGIVLIILGGILVSK